jgi:hypothetical protein
MQRLRLPPADPPGIDDEEEEEAYPIRRTPSWKELNNALKILRVISNPGYGYC